MTKHLADRDQASASTQQLGSQGMSKPVRSHVWQPGPLTGPLDDITDQVRPDWSERGPARQEQMTGIFRIPTR